MTAVLAAAAGAARACPPRWRRPAAIGGAVILLAWVLVALIDPLLGLADPLRQSVGDRASTPPSAAHPFGTDQLGRDVLSRTLWGVRASLPAGRRARRRLARHRVRCSARSPATSAASSTR